MAALTPTSPTPIRENVGSLTLLVVEFASVNGGSSTGDTWTSGLGTNVVNFWCQDKTIQSTQTTAGCNVSYASATGIFTLNPEVNGDAVTLFVLARV